MGEKSEKYIHMPVLDGLAATKVLRVTDGSESIPVILPSYMGHVPSDTCTEPAGAPSCPPLDFNAWVEKARELLSQQ